MEKLQEEHYSEIDQIIGDLEETRRFTGSPNEFWPKFLGGSSRLVGAKLGILLVQGEGEVPWRNLCLWPAGTRSALNTPDLGPRIIDIAGTSALKGYAFEGSAYNKTIGSTDIIIGVRLDLAEGEYLSVAIFILPAGAGSNMEEIVFRLKLVADIPASYQLGRITQQAKSDVVQFSEALDLMTLLNAEKKYMATAMTFCNEISSRYRCSRVSLGWLQDGYIRLQTMSHMEKFEKKMEAVQSLEAAMEEAFDQDEEILWPQPPDNNALIRAHEAFSREQDARYIVSLPIRLDSEPIGVLTCERIEEPFSETDIRGLRVICDQSARRLDDLKRHDRWFGARMASSLKETLSRLVGVEHTFAKALGIILFMLLAFLLFGKLNYRVEAPFILKTDDLLYLPAPFDGYIDDVFVQVGDMISADHLLLNLDNKELLLEESAAIASISRYDREAEKARAENALAEMKIARAMQKQAEAQLELIHYQLNNAELKAPFAGIIVEGDLKKMLGAPVRKGDILFKVALIEKMYAEIDISEKDVHEVNSGQTGEIAFVSQPDLKFPITLKRVDPVAVTREEGNVFVGRAAFAEDVADWWRPGMSGVSKVNIGKRNVLWILTHRTIDFFRMLLWW
ncbi:efflux RND transporter periplasmic adaptor subunit [Thermodesulfobacteriota bacterium]